MPGCCDGSSNGESSLGTQRHSCHFQLSFGRDTKQPLRVAKKSIKPTSSASSSASQAGDDASLSPTHQSTLQMVFANSCPNPKYQESCPGASRPSTAFLGPFQKAETAPSCLLKGPRGTNYPSSSFRSPCPQIPLAPGTAAALDAEDDLGWPRQPVLPRLRPTSEMFSALNQKPNWWKNKPLGSSDQGSLRHPVKVSCLDHTSRRQDLALRRVPLHWAAFQPPAPPPKRKRAS